VGQERLGPSYFFIPLMLGPLNNLVWWEVSLGYIALRSFLFLQEQIKDIIISFLTKLSTKYATFHTPFTRVVY
jgi:hypothetical protein